jgi:hypothetical protein
VLCTVNDLTESTLSVFLPKLWDSKSSLCFDNERSHDYDHVDQTAIFLFGGHGPHRSADDMTGLRLSIRICGQLEKRWCSTLGSTNVGIEAAVCHGGTRTCGLGARPGDLGALAPNFKGLTSLVKPTLKYQRIQRQRSASRPTERE